MIRCFNKPNSFKQLYQQAITIIERRQRSVIYMSTQNWLKNHSN